MADQHSAQSSARFVLEVRIYAWHRMMDARCLMAVHTYSTGAV